MIQWTAIPTELESFLQRVEGWQLQSDALCQQPAWMRAAVEVRGADRLRPFLFRDPQGRVAAAGLFERARLDWRSGSPGQDCLRWPLQDFGYHFAPLFRHPSDGRAHWLPALASQAGRCVLDLQRSAAVLMPEDFDTQLMAEPGAPSWQTSTQRGAQVWLRGLKGNHRRDLNYYRRRIAKAGGQWVDLAADADFQPMLDELLELHRRRVAHKRQHSRYLDNDGQASLAALCRQFRSSLRISQLRLCGAPVAASLALLHRGHYHCLLTGWDPRHHKLDLGRQVIYQQLQQGFATGLLSIDLGGGDLAYKREFGLEALPTLALRSRPGRAAAARARVVQGALDLYRRVCRR